MERIKCVVCGLSISKSAFSDPYLCRDCERQMEGGVEIRRFSYLDNRLF